MYNNPQAVFVAHDIREIAGHVSYAVYIESDCMLYVGMCMHKKINIEWFEKVLQMN